MTAVKRRNHKALEEAQAMNCIRFLPRPVARRAPALTVAGGELDEEEGSVAPEDSEDEAAAPEADEGLADDDEEDDLT